MAIRLRTVNGVRVALCAAESDPLPGDVYLDDGDHHALSTKFGLDWRDMGFIDDPPVDPVVVEAMATQKVRDARETLQQWELLQAEVRSDEGDDSDDEPLFPYDDPAYGR